MHARVLPDELIPSLYLECNRGCFARLLLQRDKHAAVIKSIFEITLSNISGGRSRSGEFGSLGDTGDEDDERTAEARNIGSIPTILALFTSGGRVILLSGCITTSSSV